MDNNIEKYANRWVAKNKVCLNHPDKKVYARMLCSSCYMKLLYEENSEYRQRTLEKGKIYRSKNIDKIHEYDKKRHPIRASKKEYRDQRKDARLKRIYGISYKEYLCILSYQNNKCAICEFPMKEGDRFMHVDHDHDTLEVRGILCSQCNWFMSKVDKVDACLNNLKQYVKNKGVKWKKHCDFKKEN